jgi:hypothetical protein
VRQFVRVALVVAAAGIGCKSKPSSSAPGPTGSSETGASSPRAALETMLDAARAQDLQAMSSVWGTDKGPARDRLDRTDLEKRELVIMCYIASDRYSLANEAPEPGGIGRRFDVTITRGDRTRTTVGHVVRGPNDRWYVQEIEPNALRELCQRRPG